VSRSTRRNSRIGSADLAAAVLPAPTGTDDTAAINAILAASGGLRVVGRAGQTYIISAPLVMRSGSTLDMSGCTVRLTSGSNCNMVQNYAVGQVRRVLDAAMTSSSATLTSATGGFSSGDVGKTVTVQGAGAAGVVLTTTISAVTNSTTATLAAPAATAVTGAYAAVGARESNIAVVGGIWDRQDNGPSGAWDSHNLRFRHVDGLTVVGTSHRSTAGKYGINPGDCTFVRIRDTTLAGYSSDGVHVSGPAAHINVTGTYGTTMHDDLVSFTARDSTPIITDCAGDITDVTVDVAHFDGSTGFSSALKIVAGSGCAVRRFTARNLTSPDTTAPVVFVGDSSGGTIEDILIEDVRSLGGTTSGCVLLHGGTISKATVRRPVPAPGDSYAVSVDTTVGDLNVEDIKWPSSTGPSSYAVLIASAAGIVDTLQIIGGKLGMASGSAVLRLSTAAQLRAAHLSGIDFSGGGGLVSAPTGTSLSLVTLDECTTLNTPYPLGTYSGTTVVAPGKILATGSSTAWIYGSTASAAVTVVGGAGLFGATNIAQADSPGYVAIVPPGATILDGQVDQLTTGEETFPRLLATSDPQLTPSRLTLTYFTARKSEPITQVRTFTRGIAAATITLNRIGIYSVAANGDLTLVASTVNDVSLWSGTFATYTRSLTSTWSKQAGRRYAWGFLSVATTGPKLSGVLPVSGGEGGQGPRINGSVDSQTDLPSSITSGTVATSAGTNVYAVAMP
jgi:hypothetical protein